jgi:hypothetical protein
MEEIPVGIFVITSSQLKIMNNRIIQGNSYVRIYVFWLLSLCFFFIRFGDKITENVKLKFLSDFYFL